MPDLWTLGLRPTRFSLDKFLRFLALRMTIEPKIPGAVIPRRVFTQPGSRARIGRRHGQRPYCRNAPKPDVNSTDWCICTLPARITKMNRSALDTRLEASEIMRDGVALAFGQRLHEPGHVEVIGALVVGEAVYGRKQILVSFAPRAAAPARRLRNFRRDRHGNWSSHRARPRHRDGPWPARSWRRSSPPSGAARRG